MHRFKTKKSFPTSILSMMLVVLILSIFSHGCTTSKKQLSTVQSNLDRIDQQFDSYQQQREEHRLQRESLLLTMREISAPITTPETTNHDSPIQEPPVVEPSIEISLEADQVSTQPLPEPPLSIQPVAESPLSEETTIPILSTVAETVKPVTPAIAEAPIQTNPVQFDPANQQFSIIIISSKKQPEQENVDANSLYRSAYSQYTQGKYSDSLQNFQRAFQLALNNDLRARSLYWVGECHYRMREWSSAIQRFSEVEKIDSEHPIMASALFKKAQAYIQQGNPEFGRVTLQRLIRQYPQTEEGRLASERIQQIK